MTALETTPTTAPPDPLATPLRPRFYDGQYLSAEALALAQDYVRERLRRRNLFLHGSGVVCGLEVTCGPLPGYVTVARGYAIDGCGEDVFVPGPTPFDVAGNLPPSGDDPCVRPTLVFETGLPVAAPANVAVRRAAVTEGETLPVDTTRTLERGSTELPVSDADAATLAAGEVVRLRDLADATQTQYVAVTDSGGRSVQPALALDLDVGRVELRRVSLEIDKDAVHTVAAADAGADRLTLTAATGIAAGDVVHISADEGVGEWATVADERCDVLLYLGYLEEPDAMRRAVPSGSCTANGHCEVSRIRETFTLRVVREEEADPPPDLVDDIGACIKTLLETSGVVATSRSIAEAVESAESWTDPQLQETLSSLFTALRDKLEGIGGAGVRCRAAEELDGLEFPEPPVEGDERRFVEQLLERLATLYVYAFELAWDCVGETLLNPCRACESTEGADVLLARLTVDGRGVVEICNHDRRHVKTWPTVDRWLSPFGRGFVAPLNALRRRQDPNASPFRGPGDIVEWLFCDFDIEPLVRALVRWLLPQVQQTPTSVRSAFSSARYVKSAAGTQTTSIRRIVSGAADKVRGQVPGMYERVRSVAAVEGKNPVEAAKTVSADTGLEVAGTRTIEEHELYSVQTLRATANALVTSGPVEIAYTPEGVAFLRAAPVAAPAPAPPAAPGGPS